MAKETFIYGVARIRGIEAALLTSQDMEHLLHAKSEEEARKYLRDKGWNGADQLPLEELFATQEASIYELVEELVSDMSILDPLRLEKDFHNIRTLIREAYMQSNFNDLILAHGSLSPDQMRQWIQTKDFTSFPEDIAPAVGSAYQLLFETGDAQLADATLDQCFLKVIRQRALASKDSFLIGYADIKSALATINIAIRSSLTQKKRSFYEHSLAPAPGLDLDHLIQAALQGVESILEYLQTTPYAGAVEAFQKDFSTFEKWRDDTMMDYISSQKYAIKTIGPIAAYILARENEIRSVRILISGKRNHLDEQEIRERVRKTYV